MAKLFLSYSRKDEAKARRFTHWLERDGHDVWRDQDDIGGGASFSAEIERRGRAPSTWRFRLSIGGYHLVSGVSCLDASPNEGSG